VQPAGRWSALHQFAQAGNVEAVTFLLEHGADRNAKTKDDKTALDVAHADVKGLLEDEAPEEAAPAPVVKKRSAPSSSAAVVSTPSAPAASAPPPKKAKTGRPVDSAVPGRDNYVVVDDWSVLLNQTNVGMNNNKYYKIQLLKATDGTFRCFTHWGRVGSAGQNNLMNAGKNQALAEGEFRSKFRSKTSVPYELKDSHDWTPKVGKYTLVVTDEKEGDGGGDAPLGKLSPVQIEKGQVVLAKLELALSKGSGLYELQNLTSQYYTLIPHNFGFSLPPTINNTDMIESENELLKFYMRMGFEEEKVDVGLTPVAGIMSLPLPSSLESACSKLCAAKDIKSSTEKGKSHAAKQSGNPPEPMEDKLYASIMLYTSNAIYKDLNNVLRSEDRTKIKKYFGYLRLFLEALGSLPQITKTLWRGVNVDLFDQYSKGSTVTWWGVSSCTSDVNVAKNFMKGCGGKCTLLTVQSKTAADISEITFFGNEKEHLLAPGTQLKVLSSVRNGNVTEISLVETGRVLE